MATVTATRAAATFPVFGGSSGNLRVAWGTYEVASNLAAATIIQMVRVPAGATVVGGYWYGDDLEAGADELDWDFGWEANGDEVADPDGFGNFGPTTGAAVTQVKPVAGILWNLQGVLLADGPKTFNRETTLSFTVIVDAATTGTGTVSVVVFYAMP